ncbi:MAG: hypothetical protein HGA45_25595 [Chloroflexales bacterium]|nr:hypothetical protein [Chloroflexales bacterium]
MAATLVSKLQLKPGQRLVVLHAPAGYLATLAEALAGVFPTDEPLAGADAALVFVTELAHSEARTREAAALLRPGGLLWVAYAKGGSKLPTDVNRDRLWVAVEPTGWRPVRQVAIDEVWSGMRFRPADDVGR